MILKAWRRTWPGSTRSVEARKRNAGGSGRPRSVARPEEGPRVFAPRRRKLWRGPQSSIRSSVPPAPCAVRCAARVAAKIPLNPRRVAPCIAPRSALVPSVLHATDRHDGRHSLSVALLTPATHSGRLPADLLAGVRRVLLARARPSASVRSVTPLAPTGCCSPHSAVAPPSMTPDVRSLVDRPAQPRTCTIPLEAGSCIDPTRKARDRAVAPRPASPPGQPPAGWPKGQRRPP